MFLSTVPQGWVIAVWFGLIGLCIGSFMNVVCYRLPIMRKLGVYADGKKLQALVEKHGKFNLSYPRSSCPCCDTPIKIKHNIPVLSWVALRGKCAACAAPIPMKYPAIELLFGLAFGSYVWIEGVWVAGLITLPLMAMGFCLFTIMAQTKRVIKPLAVVYVSLIVLQMILTNMGYSSYAP